MPRSKKFRKLFERAVAPGFVGETKGREGGRGRRRGLESREGEGRLEEEASRERNGDEPRENIDEGE